MPSVCVSVLLDKCSWAPDIALSLTLVLSSIVFKIALSVAIALSRLSLEIALSCYRLHWSIMKQRGNRQKAFLSWFKFRPFYHALPWCLSPFPNAYSGDISYPTFWKTGHRAWSRSITKWPQRLIIKYKCIAKVLIKDVRWQERKTPRQESLIHKPQLDKPPPVLTVCLYRITFCICFD